MGTIQHDLVIVTAYSWHAKEAEEAWAVMHSEAEQMQAAAAPAIERWTSLLIGPVKPIANFGNTYLVAPDGSKEGWSISERGNKLRERFVELMSPFGEVIALSYGEMGVFVDRGSDTAYIE